MNRIPARVVKPAIPRRDADVVTRRHSPSSGTIGVFVRGGDNGLWQKTYNNGS
jgi:hypothetical protein